MSGNPRSSVSVAAFRRWITAAALCVVPTATTPATATVTAAARAGAANAAAVGDADADAAADAVRLYASDAHVLMEIDLSCGELGSWRLAHGPSHFMPALAVADDGVRVFFATTHVVGELNTRTGVHATLMAVSEQCFGMDATYEMSGLAIDRAAGALFMTYSNANGIARLHGIRP
jgi:hypothetical protein